MEEINNPQKTDIYDSKPKTLLFHAVESGNPDMVEYLLDKGADPNFVGKEGVSETNILDIIIFYYMMGVNLKGKHLPKVPLLMMAKSVLEHGGVTASWEHGTIEEPLYNLLKKYNMEKKTTVKTISEAVDIDQEDGNGETALIQACQNQDEKMVEYLLQKGADLYIENWSHHDAMYYAIVYRRIGSGNKIIDLLKKYGYKKPLPGWEACLPRLLNNNNMDESVDVNLKQRGVTSLLSAVSRNQLEVVKYLISKGARLDIRSDKIKSDDPGADKGEWSPLVVAAGNGFEDMFSLLLSFGADKSITLKDINKLKKKINRIVSEKRLVSAHSCLDKMMQIYNERKQK